MGKNSREITVTFISVSIPLDGQHLYGKFTPLTANSFLSVLTPFWKGFVIEGHKEEVPTVVPLCIDRCHTRMAEALLDAMYRKPYYPQHQFGGSVLAVQQYLLLS